MYKVIENRYVGEDMYLLRVEGKFEGKMGQFYMLRFEFLLLQLYIKNLYYSRLYRVYL